MPEIEENADQSQVNPDLDSAGTKNGKQDDRQAQYEFSDLDSAEGSSVNGNLDFILDIPLEITVELGRSEMVINELLKLGQGSVIELAKNAGETMEILANRKLIARGEVVTVNDQYGVRVTEILSPLERIESLK